MKTFRIHRHLKYVFLNATINENIQDEPTHLIKVLGALRMNRYVLFFSPKAIIIGNIQDEPLHPISILKDIINENIQDEQFPCYKYSIKQS